MFFVKTIVSKYLFSNICEHDRFEVLDHSDVKEHACKDVGDALRSLDCDIRIEYNLPSAHALFLSQSSINRYPGRVWRTLTADMSTIYRYLNAFIIVYLCVNWG